MPPYRCRRCTTAFLLLALAVALPASAQSTRAEAIAAAKADKATKAQPLTLLPGQQITDRIERLFTKPPPKTIFTVGGLRGGAGFALGAGYALPLGEHGTWTSRTGWSIKNFKLVESTAIFTEIGRPGISGGLYARWQDAPKLWLFGLGNDTSRSGQSRFALRSVEAGGGLDFRGARVLRAGVGAEYLRVDTGPGSGGSVPSIETLFYPRAVPGVGSDAEWLHSQGRLGVDWRESPGYTRRGGLYQVTYHDYRTIGDRPFDFGRLEIDLRQFIPLLNENWIVALRGYSEITYERGDAIIPHYMLPYVGGGSSLRGYRRYRFTDRHSLLLSAELRWTPSRMLDMAIFVDQGKVASQVRDLDLEGLHPAWGLGARFHGPTFTALRLEIARGREGWKYHVANHMSF